VKIVVGLGNPGRKYDLTRHNAGFMVIDKLAISESFSGSAKGFMIKDAYQSLVNKGRIGLDKVLLVKPQTYMNKSGDAVAGIMQNISEPVDGLLVVSDDYNLPLGSIRFRREGASGGHNGLQSIIGQLGGDKFHRLRIGIGTPGSANDPIDFVLEKFSKPEMKEMDQAFQTSVEAIVFYIQNGIDKSMNKYN
jgi:PTH1 family peptidyl-tRNA hydrolase